MRNSTVRFLGYFLLLAAGCIMTACSGGGGGGGSHGSSDSVADLLSLAQEAYIKASNTGANDYFGYSVSLSGDTLAVGAFREGDDSGAVYVFTRSGTTWTQQAYIKASNAEAGDEFGISISLSGDTLAVGAFNESSSATGIDGDQEDNSALYSGAVYVFTRSGTTWTQQEYIKASNTDARDRFGYSVSLSEDTLAVGAYQEDSRATGIDGDQADDSASDSGAVYVFTRSGTDWTQQAYLKASNTEAWDYFGYSVSLSGDTLSVGAPQESGSATGIDGDDADNSAWASGATYVFTRSGTTWTQQAYIKASNTGQLDTFGTTLFLSGDTLAVGAPGEDSIATGINGNDADNSAPESGAVYVFTRSGTTWTQQEYIKASNTGQLDTFGATLSLSGDTLAVGASQESSGAMGIDGDQIDNSAPYSGAVFILRW